MNSTVYCPQFNDTQSIYSTEKKSQRRLEPILMREESGLVTDENFIIEPRRDSSFSVLKDKL